MSKVHAIGLSAIVLVMMAGVARAEDISTKKMQIKDNADSAKRQVQVQSADVGVQVSEVDDPATNGASIHVYSATDDYCAVLPAGPEWQLKNGIWKYNDKVTKNKAQVKDGKLSVKLKSGVTYTLNEPTQGVVNAQVQFGDLGVRYCMRCSVPTKDDNKQYQAKACALTACDAEPSICDPSTTTTTLPPVLPGTVLKAVLPRSNGFFTYALTPGVPGADVQCNNEFAGSHACVYSELQAAEIAGDLDGIKDVDGLTVTSFWAIDPLASVDRQCRDAAMSRWVYLTAHIATGGDSVTLNNGTGALGALVMGGALNRNCGSMKWVGCCQ